jgi:hypothetical protein
MEVFGEPFDLARVFRHRHDVDLRRHQQAAIERRRRERGQD